MASDQGAADPLQISGITDVAEIGRGPRGTVYRARQPALDRDVVVKVFTGAHDNQGGAGQTVPRPSVPAHPHLLGVY